MSTTVLLINGFLKVALYAGGFCFTFYRKRLMLVIGFGLAAFISGVRAIDDATRPQDADIGMAAALGTVVAIMFVGSFVAAQPRGGRPHRWSP